MEGDEDGDGDGPDTNVQSLEGSSILARLGDGARIAAAFSSFIRSLLRAHCCTNYFLRHLGVQLKDPKFPELCSDTLKS